MWIYVEGLNPVQFNIFHTKADSNSTGYNLTGTAFVFLYIGLCISPVQEGSAVGGGGMNLMLSVTLQRAV